MSLSIIIPYYNADAYIEQCILSVSKSISDDDEIIIINDGSTPESFFLLEQIVVKYQKIKIYSQKNSGPNVARNLGIEKANGKFILFIDADDYFSENALDLIRNEISLKVYDIYIYGIHFYNDKDGKTIKKICPIKRSVYERSILKEVLVGNDYAGVCWNKVYRSEFLKKSHVRFFEDNGHGRDILFTKEIGINAKSILFINRILCYSRYHDDSFSRKFSLKNIASAVENAELIHKLKIKYEYLKNSSFYFDCFIAKHFRYILIISAFRLNSFADFQKAFILVKKSNYFYTIDLLNDKKFVEPSLPLKIFNLIIKRKYILWALCRTLSKLNFKPY